MLKSELIRALMNAKGRHLSGFIYLDSERLLNKKSGKELVEIAYYSYLKQRLAKWGGLSAEKIATFSLGELVDRLTPLEAGYKNSPVIDDKGHLLDRRSIVKVFLSRFGSQGGKMKKNTREERTCISSKVKDRRRSISKTRTTKSRSKKIDRRLTKGKKEKVQGGQEGQWEKGGNISHRSFSKKHCEGKGGDQTWTADQVRTALRHYGLKVGGTKQVICQRLRTFLKTGKKV